jgi:hypothetical protein
MKINNMKEIKKEIELDGNIYVLKEKTTTKADDAEFKVGDWVIADCHDIEGYLGKLTKITNNSYEMSEYSIPTKNTYTDLTGMFTNIQRLATPEEIERHLITEAKRRGYKKYTIVKSTAPNSLSSAILVGEPKFSSLKRCRFNDDSLITTHNSIYFNICNSKPIVSFSMNIYSDEYGWAEIIEEPKIKIGSNTVEFDEDFIKVGCQSFPNSLIKDISSVKNSINGTDVRIFTINYEDDEIAVKFGSTNYNIPFDTFKKICDNLND